MPKPPEPQVERVQTEDSRFYKIMKGDETLYFPSVTTILGHVKVNSQFLDNWKEEQSEKIGMLGKRLQLELDKARGTAVHSAIERWHAGRDLDWKRDGLTDDEWARVCRYMHWEEEREPRFSKNEFVVFSEKMGYAGQADGVAKIGDRTYIIDFKTGKDIYDTHLLQGAAYVMAHREMGFKCDGILVLALAARTKKGWKDAIIEGEELEHYSRGFRIHLDLFGWANKDFSPHHDILPLHFKHKK